MKANDVIPISARVKNRLILERVVPPVALLAVLGATVFLWRHNAAVGNAVGIAEGVRSTVTSAQAGMLEEVRAAPYQRVRAGDTLAILRPIDPRAELDQLRFELETTIAELQPTLAQENALDYERLRVELLRTQAELAMAEVNLHRSENQVRRHEPLYGEQLVSEDVYDLSLMNRDLFQAEVETKSNAVAQIQERLDVLQQLGIPEQSTTNDDTLTAIEQILEGLRSDSPRVTEAVVVTAPFDGMISDVHHQAGEQVVPGEPLFTLSSLHAGRVVGYVRQPYPFQPQIGQRVLITTRETPPQRWWTEITEVGAHVEVLTNALAMVRLGALIDTALPFAVRMPASAALRPGELVHLRVVKSSTPLPGGIAQAAGNSTVNGSGAPSEDLLVFTGASDASAAAALDFDRMVVADDEESLLRVYDRRKGGPPIQHINLKSFLAGGANSGEADLEGAARVGDRVYWISSHGRNASGKLQLSRHRFFATAIRGDERAEVVPIGRPYLNLVRDLNHDARLRRFRLDRAAERAPKARGGLNIEGLAPLREGGLLIGFRNPVPGDQALLIPLLNPDALLAGETATFGEPVLMDLGGHGIRSITRLNDGYVIVAGSWEGGGRSRLYTWAGPGSAPKAIDWSGFSGFNPEAVLVVGQHDNAALQFLSDDGTELIDGVQAKHHPDPTRRRFRSIIVPLNELGLNRSFDSIEADALAGPSPVP